MTTDQLNEELKYFLQRNVAFKTTARVFKKGRMVLFNINGHYITFNVETAFSNKLQTYEVPFPFKVHKIKEGVLHLDYTFESLYKNDLQVKMALINEKLDCKSKYLDTIVILEAT